MLLAASQWSVWGEWGTCTKPCGGGETVRYRKCLSTDSYGYGQGTVNDCQGLDFDTSICNAHCCASKF